MLGSSKPWRIKWKRFTAESSTSEPPLGFLRAQYALLFGLCSGPAEKRSAHGLRHQPPLNDVKIGPLSPQGLKHGPEGLAIGRAGKNEDTTLLELFVPELRVIRRNLHFDEDRVGSHPDKSPCGQYRGQRDKEHEDQRTDAGGGEREEERRDGENCGEPNGDHKPSRIVGHYYVARPSRKRFRLVGVLTLEDHREVLARYPKLSQARDGLVELGAVVDDCDHGVLGTLVCLPAPRFAQLRITPRRAYALHYTLMRASRATAAMVGHRRGEEWYRRS